MTAMGRATLFLVALGFSASATHAHHSIARVYDSSRQVTIEGTVDTFHFVNPHPFLVLDGDGGAAAQWRLEMDNRSELAQVGMTDGTLRPGDRIIVTGSLSRTHSQSLYVRRLERPADGFGYEQVGNSPRIRPGSP